MENPTAKADLYTSASSGPSAEPASDFDLIKASKLGDDQSFNVLVMKYGDRVHNHCRRIVDDEAECADLTQEVFLKVFRNLANYEHAYSFYTWIYRITVNTCIDYMRKKRRRISEVSLTHSDHSERWDRESEQEIADETYCPEERMMNLELGAEITRAMEKLPVRLRSYIILKDVEGLTYSEIATVFDCSAGTVKSSLFNARQKLKSLLGHRMYN